MKVILLKDVKDLGKKYDVKNVSDGHALNFLIPSGLVEAATGALIKKIEAQKNADHAMRMKEEEALLESLESIKGNKVEITEKANEKGHLFSAIHKSEIIAAIKHASGVEFLVESIKLDKPIKEVGEHSVEIQAAGKSVKIKITVKAA
jgi:large subunit ribosomal protein L9